jgi:hypothetical protein
VPAGAAEVVTACAVGCCPARVVDACVVAATATVVTLDCAGADDSVDVDPADVDEEADSATAADPVTDTSTVDDRDSAPSAPSAPPPDEQAAHRASVTNPIARRRNGTDQR